MTDMEETRKVLLDLIQSYEWVAEQHTVCSEAERLDLQEECKAAREMVAVLTKTAEA